MNWEFLLEKEDRQKLQLLRLLDRQPNQKVRIKEIQEMLGYSYYLVKNTILEIEKDILELDLSNYFAIEITETYVNLYEKMNANTTLFLHHYLRGSIQVKILTELFFKEHFSISQFAEEHFSSYAFVYKRFLQLKQNLKDEGIKIDRRNRIVGEEHTIWLFFGHLFQTIYSIEEICPPEQFRLIEQTVNRIQPFLAKTLTETVKANFYQLLLVFLTRYNQGRNLRFAKKERQLLERLKPANQALFDGIKQEITRAFDLPDETIEEEGLFLLNLLYTESLTEPIGQLFPEAETLVITNFITEFEQVFQMKLAEAEERNLRSALELLVWDVFCFPARSRFFVDTIEITYFKNSYPEYFDFCQRVMSQTKLVDNKVQGRFLFYYGLLTLIRFIPITRVSEAIEVCIDFSIGESYNDLIKRDLLYFSSLNIEVVTIQSEKTRLILTDAINLANNYPSKKIVWLTPPRPEDWEQVVDELIGMRQENSAKYLDQSDFQ